jgi:hypothetical protein
MTTTQVAGTEALRLGTGSAVILVWSGDRDTAIQAATDWANNCPRYNGMKATIKRVTPRANRYSTLGYEGPATSVTVGFVRN